MITLVLQSVCTVLLGTFTVLALLTARRLRSAPGDSPAAWMLVGCVFAFYVVDKAIQEVFGISAYFAGPQAPVWSFYLRLAPIADHSRTFLMFALYAGLAALPFRHRLGGHARTLAIAAVALTLVGGALFGWTEGPFAPLRHLSRTAAIDVVGFIVLGATLLLLMVRSDVDRMLWFSIAVYGFTSVLGVLFLSALAWSGIAPWTPSPWSMQAMRCLFAALMAGLAWSRYRSILHGQRVQPMLQPMPTAVRTM